VRPNRVAYASAISACATGGQWVLAIKLLDDMREVGVSPDVRHCAAAIAACDKGGAWEMALKLLLRMDGRGVPPNTVAYNSAISACARAAQWRAALALLERMTPAPSPSLGAQGGAQGGGQGAMANTVSYNSAISACGRGGAWEAALRLATSMEGGGVRADAITHNSVLDALARAAQWRDALRYLHSLLRRGGRGSRGAVAPDAVALCTAISACEAAGAWRATRDLLWDGKIRAGPGEAAAGGEGESGDEGGEGGNGGERGGVGRDETATAVGSAAFALGGEADAVQAAEAVDELRAAFAAEAATGRLGAAYAAGVRACARAAQLRSGVLLLLQAEALQGGSLDASAYAALRDAAAAAGELELSRRMQRQRRFVGSADAEGALPPGPRAGATPLASFELENALVACANGFNASSASDVFLAVRPEGVAAIDAAREARDMVAQLRRARVNSYAPRLAALPAHVARGRSVQWQRTILAQHCEKKALAAQLALDYPAPTLRTTHRMCIDCHDVFLAASLAYNRTIACQDPGHLHVFERGRCSCGGRWRGQPAVAEERTRR
jgi:pentatricopeptide repeat protein